MKSSWLCWDDFCCIWDTPFLFESIYDTFVTLPDLFKPFLYDWDPSCFIYDPSWDNWNSSLLYGFPNSSAGKERACQCRIRDTSSIPGSVRSLREGNGSPFQYSCLENSMDSGAWWATVHGVTKSQTWLSVLTHTYTHTLPYGSAISLLGIYSLRNKNWCSHKTCTQMFIVAYIILFLLFGYYWFLLLI